MSNALYAASEIPHGTSRRAAMDSLPTDSTTAPTPTVGHDATTTFMGMVTEHGRDGLLRWWPLAVVVVVLLLLGIGARRQPSENPTTWYVSRSRILWLGRTLRRPVAAMVASW